MTPYPTKKDTPNRKTRKGARNKVFMQNRNETKLRKKLQRRKAQSEGGGS